MDRPRADETDGGGEKASPRYTKKIIKEGREILQLGIYVTRYSKSGELRVFNGYLHSLRPGLCKLRRQERGEEQQMPQDQPRVGRS